MRTLITLCFFTLLSISSAGQTFFYLEQVSINPPEPAAGEPVSVTISGQKATPCVEVTLFDLYEAGPGNLNLDMCFADDFCIQILDPWDTTVVLMDGLVADSYTLTLGGCFHNGIGNTYTFEVVGSAAPNANFNYDTEVGCVPQEVSFNNLSQNADEFLWNFGDGNTSTEQDPVHIYETAGVYTVILTATDSGTGDSDTQIFTDAIHIFDPPTMSLGPDPIWHVPDDNELAPDGTFAEYLWSDGSTDPTLFFPAGSLELGDYDFWLTVTDENGCTATDTITVTVAILENTKDLFAQLSIQTSPNPTQDRLLIQWDNSLSEMYGIDLFNTTGQMLVQQSILPGQSTASLDVSAFPTGIYLIRMHTTHGQITTKILKQ